MLSLLLTVVLSVVLSWASMAWVESGVSSPHYNHDLVRSELMTIKQDLALRALASKSGTIPPGCPSNKDPWGNSYPWTPSKSHDMAISDFQVYSPGEDGTSASQGNDPDDINSWDNHHHDFYTRGAERHRLRGYLLIVLMNSIPAFFAIHAIDFGWRKIRLRSSGP